MSLLLARIARTLTHHWIRGMLGALAVLIVLGVISSVGGEAADDFSTPGTESQKAIDLFQEHSPALAGLEATLVFYAEDGKITDPDKQAIVQAALEKVKALPLEKQVSDPFAEGGTISEDGKLASADVRYTVDEADVNPEDGRALIEALETADKGGVEASARGVMIDLGSEQELPVGELVGIGIAIILLWVLFRSKVAMLVTLLGALLGVFLGQMLLAALAAPLGLPSFAAFIATMLGLGAGIDYALLIIGRYREQVVAGDTPRDASAKAAATSGASVVAAGLIVMLAIAGLLVIGIPFIGKLGLGAAIAVGGVVVSALTVLPALIGAFSRWLKPKDAKHTRPSPVFEAWGERVTRRPWLSIAGGVLILLIFAFPVTQMRLGQPDDGNQPDGKLQRVAYDRLSQAFGAGSNGPFFIAINTPDGADKHTAEFEKLQQAIAGDPNIAQASPAAPQGDNGEMAVIFAIPKSAPQDAATSDLLSRLREDVILKATQGTPLADNVFVGGAVPVFEDLSDKVASRLPVFILTVIGLSVLLLIMAFRSLWIPLVSAVFNLLSVGAAYGVVVAVFQEGIGAGLVGSDSGVPIVSFIPVMLFAILFGLSMDYNVFLLSRVHEAYNEGDGPRESVIHGMARIGKVILFAGPIMAAVFLAFVTQPDVVGKMMGLGLGLAILIDVLFVRLIIAPAVVTLLGDKAWWLPGWLDRILPNVSLEGHLVEGLDKELTQEHDVVDSGNGHSANGGAATRETSGTRE